MRLNYILIPAITVVVAGLGSALTMPGLAWYQTLIFPVGTPPSWVFAPVWTAIFILTAASALIIWNLPRRRSDLPIRSMHWSLIFAVFGINAILNVLWSYLFFYEHLLGGAFIGAILLLLSVLALIGLIWSLSRQAAIFLLPYAGWVSYASFLTYEIWRLNS
jgi:tryptophan-rich sensory protein